MTAYRVINYKHPEYLNTIFCPDTLMNINHIPENRVNGKWYLLSALFIISLTCFFMDNETFAATYYVDGSCANDGDGLADQCASSPSGPGSYKSPQSCFTAAVAEDTCLIKNGTYLSSTPGKFGGFTIGNSGASGNPITFQNYPGHSPVFRNCVVTSTACDHPTISGISKSYVTIKGLTVHGAIYIFCATFGSFGAGVTIQNNNINEGWEALSDGNWSPLRLENCTGAQVDHNYLHDPIPIGTQYPGANDRASGMVWFQVHNSVNEYNTIKNFTNTSVGAGGIVDKADSQNNIHRYNWIENIGVQCFFINNQLRGVNVSIYGNICNNAWWGVELVTGITGASVYNNTIYGSTNCLYATSAGGTTNVSFYNNICDLPNSGGENGNYVNYGSAFLTKADYNRFTPDKGYRISSSAAYSSLSAYQAAQSTDDNSSGSSCSFVNPGTNFHLQTGSSCKNAGRVGGVSTGTAVDVGAYGVTSCVGHTCGAFSAQLVPPQNLTVR